MRIKKSSWHYKLHKWVRDPLPDRAERPSDLLRMSKKSEPNLPKSLCGYFWATLALSIIYVPMILLIAVGGVLVALLYGIYWVSIRHLVEKRGRKKDEERREAIRLEKKLWEAYHRGEITYDELRRRVDAIGKKKSREPGLLRSFLAARKRKVCPLIEVVDE